MKKLLKLTLVLFVTLLLSITVMYVSDSKTLTVSNYHSDNVLAFVFGGVGCVSFVALLGVLQVWIIILLFKTYELIVK